MAINAEGGEIIIRNTKQIALPARPGVAVTTVMDLKTNIFF